jgi:hypothetical protein
MRRHDAIEVSITWILAWSALGGLAFCPLEAIDMAGEMSLVAVSSSWFRRIVVELEAIVATREVRSVGSFGILAKDYCTCVQTSKYPMPLDGCDLAC